MKTSNQAEETINKRLTYVFYLCICIVIIIFSKLAYLTISGLGEHKGEENLAKEITIKHDIVDRNGNVLAISIPSSSVFLSLNQIKDKALVISALVEVLKFSQEKATALVNSKSNFVWVKRNISKKEEIELKYYGVLGLNFKKEYTRFYPYGSLFSHVVGIVNIDGYGVSGVESSFNDVLKNRTVELSLDLKMQSILWEVLSKAKETHQAKAVYGMLIDPNSSEVLAMVSLPDYNPNDKSKINIANMFNYTTQGLIEPGSIAKVFSVAMALDKGVVDVDTILDVSKPIIKGKYIITDYSYIGRSITIPEVLMYSSNIGTSLLVRRMGVNSHREYIEKFNLLERTSLEIPEKERPLLSNQWTDLNSMTISYGYGLALSQATFINSFAAMINGGIYRPITIIKQEQGVYPKESRVISEEVSKQIRGSLRLTTALGLARRADVVGYNTAGKTGSTEKLVKGQYKNNTVIASFAGFFPAYMPQYAIVVSVDEPKRLPANNYNITGGMLAAPIFSEIVEKIGIAYGIKQDKDNITTSVIESPSSIKNYIDNFPYFAIN